MSSQIYKNTRGAAMLALGSQASVRQALAQQVLAQQVLAQQDLAQSDDQDPEMRIQQLENQLRQLTGQNEELQYRNRQLEERLRSLQGGAQVAPGGQNPIAQPNVATVAPTQPGSAYRQPPVQPGYGQQIAAPIAQEPEGVPPAPGRRRGDAFDPNQNPNAPGEPLNLGNANPPGAGGALTTLPPSATPKDEFDLGIGYMERKDYALAEETMRNFAQKYPSDPLTADSQYWLGESFFQRQRYRDAAESFLGVTTKFDKSAKAPDALLRLGQSLAALKEKEAACAALGEVTRKYPRAAGGVKAAVDREQKRVKC